MTHHETPNTADKMETHYRLQLSALIDGELTADEARFLLRRLQHDTELSACWDRWQVAGEVMRGQTVALAPAGFSERIALAIAEASAGQVTHAAAAGERKPRHLFRWGGGALAASFALVALFITREQVPEQGVDPAAAPTPAVATHVPAPSPIAQQHPVETAGSMEETASPSAPVLVASLPQRQDNTPRRSATRTRQAARSSGAVDSSMPAVAHASALPSAAVAASVNAPSAATLDPFSPHRLSSDVPARPWPRAVLPEYSGNAAFNAAHGSSRTAQTFYPFEPRLPAEPDIDAGQDRPSSQD